MSDKPSRTESISDAYNDRVANLEASEQLQRDEAAKAEEGFEHPDTPLVEEQRFVGNPEDLRKSVPSEEEFSAGLTDGEPDDGLPGNDKPAKKTAAKKG